MKKPRLVLLPGLDGTGRLFEPLLEELGDSVELIVVSFPADECLSYDGLVQYVVSVLDPEETYHILAESFSGPLAIKLAASEKLKIESIMFCATFASAPRTVLMRLARIMPLELLMRMRLPGFLIRKYLLGNSASSSLVQMLSNALSRVSPNVLAHRVKLVLQVDVRDLLDEIHVPCLYLSAEHDKLVPESCVLPFKRDVKDLRIERVEGSHMLLQSMPDECAGIIKTMLL